MNPKGEFTRRYLILEVVRVRLENDIDQANRNIPPDGVLDWVGAVPSHDEARTRNGRALYSRDD